MRNHGQRLPKQDPAGPEKVKIAAGVCGIGCLFLVAIGPSLLWASLIIAIIYWLVTH